MALPVLSSRNAVQVPGGQTTKIARVTSQATGIYTVPTGKVSKIFSASLILNAVGVDLTYAICIKRGSTIIPLGESVGVLGKSVVTPPLILQAADQVTEVGDNGSTNGTVDMTCTFQEFDA